MPKDTTQRILYLFFFNEFVTSIIDKHISGSNIAISIDSTQDRSGRIFWCIREQ